MAQAGKLGQEAVGSLLDEGIAEIDAGQAALGGADGVEDGCGSLLGVAWLRGCRSAHTDSIRVQRDGYIWNRTPPHYNKIPAI